MTNWEAQGKLIGMAKEKSLVPWSQISRIDDDIICFEGCMFFFYGTYVMIWCIGVVELEVMRYDEAIEADFMRCVDMIDKVNGARQWNL